MPGACAARAVRAELSAEAGASSGPGVYYLAR